MWLIHVSSMTLKEFMDDQMPEYAILSHRWTVDEVSFSEFTNPDESVRNKSGYRKILNGCRKVRGSGLDYFWVDTCCIDKRSSADLSEAINSMYRWYSQAKWCFAYLSDVDFGDASSPFRRSKWFTRGWTLQELVAPKRLVFFNATWQKIGTKKGLAGRIKSITGIDKAVLIGKKSVFECSVATRMSWTYVPAWNSPRETSRKEDVAYSLMGIFDVNMPMLYGEGEKAFLRLQEEILRHSRDHTIFAWRDPKALDDAECGLLATEPGHFRFSRNLAPLAGGSPEELLVTLSNNGLAIKAEVIHNQSGLGVFLQCYASEHEKINEDVLRPYIYLRCVNVVESQFRRIRAGLLPKASRLTRLPIQTIYVRSRLEQAMPHLTTPTHQVVRLNIVNRVSSAPAFAPSYSNGGKCKVTGCWLAPHSFLFTPHHSQDVGSLPFRFGAQSTRDIWDWIPTPTGPKGDQYSHLRELCFSLPVFLNTPAVMVEIEDMVTLLLGRGIKGGVGLQAAPVNLLNAAKLQRTTTLGGWMPDLGEYNNRLGPRSIAFDNGAVIAVTQELRAMDTHVEYTMHIDLNMLSSNGSW